ncbi:hypothetical protein AU252_11155 [Pseudarthrobacter sulfonivorans]|uniref:Squalene cyclase n=1 Tax=Pseudarthrobacter sulfonivorans TaxID=121292 RepID=A0A0U3FCW4_9MICC|nr:hypothetical protein [Pseudarthrobacter sulfonivorans]ALV41641.1 hypothetical protein AU252_11155 [Pseudarthrobacter sulfonivorans]
MDVLNWLLDSDPAIRWQVLGDLADAPANEISAERHRVATHGWGVRLLQLQGTDGQWDGGTYWPANDDDPNSQPWTATTYSLLLLRDFGLDPASREARHAITLVRDNSRWEAGKQLFFEGEIEPCINGMAVALGAYFGENVDAVVERLGRDQLADGGWNCEAERGSRRSSFHTTICVLEGLLEHERSTGGTSQSRQARRLAEEYLLERVLLRRKSTGEMISPDWLQFSYPTRWYYDVLRGLDYFRATGRNPDERMSEAVDVVRSKQQPNGTWLLENTHPGRVHFALEAGDGQPSRWNTLRALRVFKWFDAS